MAEWGWNESALGRAKREFAPAYLGLGGVAWSIVWAAIAIAASIYFSEGQALGARIVVGVGLFLAGITVAAITTWLFLWGRAMVRQRDEARAGVIELTEATPFPNVEIHIARVRQAWQDHAGHLIEDARTHRFWWPVVVTNREETRRVSLSFDVSILSPDANGVLVPSLPVEQEDELPLVVDPQNSQRTRLSLFLNDYVTERLREERTFQGRTVYDINGDLLRLNVFDRLSQKRIEMRLPGTYPQQQAPPETATSG